MLSRWTYIVILNDISDYLDDDTLLQHLGLMTGSLKSESLTASVDFFTLQSVLHCKKDQFNLTFSSVYWWHTVCYIECLIKGTSIISLNLAP